MNSLQSKLEELYLSQQQGWPAFADAIQGLNLVQSRTIFVANSQLLVQNNPARIRSTAAKVDAKSLAERACFLCRENRPKEQRGVELLNGKYIALINPFPVLPFHYTVVANDHVRQDVTACIDDFINLSYLLSDDSVLIFNGAKAGASAPDHLHFQIIPSDPLPIYRELLSSHEKPAEGLSLLCFAGVSYLHFHSQSPAWLVIELRKVFEKLHNKAKEQLDLINLMVFKSKYGISVVLVPRKAHRPSCFSAEGAAKFLLSPAAIELSGVVVLPRVEDFDRIDGVVLEQVFNEVCWSREDCEGLCHELSRGSV